MPRKQLAIPKQLHPPDSQLAESGSRETTRQEEISTHSTNVDVGVGGADSDLLPISRQDDTNPSHPHVCGDCGKSFSRNTNLTRHKLTHQPRKDRSRFNCPQCEKYFMHDHHLTRHLISHLTGEDAEKAKFHCDFPGCEKSFSDTQRLRRHKEIHERGGFRCKRSRKCTVLCQTKTRGTL
ncbi:hypothetical protein T439DRAFT_54150 [Meredithblackwellia eburnea MCA 4105]